MVSLIPIHSYLILHVLFNKELLLRQIDHSFMSPERAVFVQQISHILLVHCFDVRLGIG